ncbi:rho GTPase-activating protein 100F isoform X1 [Stomoxys calcitrans]|uniref:rho GTPase-activating protein 100F isoform X1 n=1 Tax=Stomoxys calcitrans TaxID=35570 RepID=UPI0027E27553|nr:rho GTPase-activating protein 100F isoform X1 [Stomoxys calcitrans]XP_013103119.2 rho GTPase-activating protein 100F isoform X1 [Stomoxys calcitrans]
MQWKKKFTRLKAATGHSRARRMLCCGRRKENGRSVPDVTASPGRAPPGPLPSNQMQTMVNQQQQQQQHHHQQQQSQHQQHHQQRQGGSKEPVLLQGDFRKVSGISSEIFRQIEAVENDHDPNTAAALEAVERRGEMIVRILEPHSIGGKQAVDAAHKLLAKKDNRHIVQLVEIVKRPGQTLGLYIREGNGADRTDGVFISRIAIESAVSNSGCLKVGDEILAVNLVDVTHMSLDDVVIIMSIPRRLVLAIRQRCGNRGTGSPGPPSMSRPEQKPPPVVVMKRDLRDEELDETDHMSRSRSSRERRTGDGREMSESRSRLGLGLNNYSPQSEQLDMYYNTRPGIDPPNWGYKPPPPPSSVITEQPKGHTFAPSHAYYKNAGTLESLAEKVHSFYPGAPPSRRLSVGNVPQRARFPRSGSDQHLPRVEYADYSNSLGRHSLLRPSLKPSGGSVIMGPGGTLGRYGRYDPHSQGKYGPSGTQSLTRRSRPNLDYSSDTEATVGPRPNYYYYNRPAIGSMPRGAGGAGTSVLGGGPDMAKFNSLPRDRPGVRLPGIRSRISDRIMDENDGNISAPEFNARRDRDLRSRITASPSIFTSDEYRAWLRRAPSSSAIAEQMRMTRDLLNQPRSHRFSCSAENIHDALRNTESIYSSRTGILGAGTLDRHLGMPRPISSLPVRSMSSQHIGGPNSIRSPSIRRMRQLLELSAGPASPSGSIMSTGGHQSPAPTPSATLPRPHRQIDINPAEFSKYKLDKPIVDIGGVSGMLWIHLLAGRGLRSAPELGPQHGAGGQHLPAPTRDLYCVIECDRVHKARTVVRSGDLQFDWDESFELDLVGNKQLDVLVYSWDPQHRHKLCYRGAISLSTVLRQSPLHQLALKVEPRGTIYIRMRHTDPIALYKRRGLPSLRAGYPTLFGADLESVVNRESKGAPGSAPVPIVLRRCVEEVERRGLDIIGLYRLCGSATKKRLLREAFERNSRAVELTPEHVPDINVITGVLKDYLRELPEPLFTRCLFQMTVDALAVCLPDDPEGNAKLMLSILDCLPRANRATLVFLLDHLSLVVSNSERNKMSAQALATVMGPPLMLHSASAQPGSDIDHAQPIAVLKYLLQIWPQPQSQHHQSAAAVGAAGNLMGSMTVGGSTVGMGLGMGLGMSAGSMSNMAGVVSGRRGESTGQRGSKVNALQVDRQAFLMQQQQQLMAAGNLLRSSTSVTNILSQGPHPLSATVNSHLYQSVVGQLAQSHRALQQAVQQPHPLVDSVVSAIPDPSPLPIPGTPSPGSSSASTASGSGSGKSTDTIKRGISPASVKHVNIQESVSSYSLSQKKSDRENALDAHSNSHNHHNHHQSHNHHSSINISNNNNNNNTNQHHQQQQSYATTALSASASSGTSGTAAHAASTTRKGVDFYEPHKSQTKSDDDNNGVVSSSSGGGGVVGSSSKYGDSAYKLRSAYASSGGSSTMDHKAHSSALSTEEYKAMRNKSSATSSSSSSQATVLSAGSAGTSATTTSSDDSDDLVSYKSSASTNALLAQSQAMTTTQLMSKYLKREPRVQFTPIKSPDSPSPPGGSSLPRGTYHLTNSSRNIHGDLGGSSSNITTSGGVGGKYTLDKSVEKAASPSKPSLSSLKEPATSSALAISPGSSSTVSSGRRLFDSLASETSETSTTGRSRTATSTTSYNNDIRHSVASSSTHISNKSTTSSEHRSFGSSLFSSTERTSAPYSSNGSNGSAHYGTLPKQSISGATLFNTASSSAAASGATASSTASGTASSSGVSSMSGSTSSYDFYTNNSSTGYSGSSVYATTSRPYANGTSSGSTATTATSGAGNYHTLGTYRVQYAATNPFLDAFDAPSESITRSGSSSTSSSEHRSSAMAAFHSSSGGESKNGSDEYDDLK